MTKKVELQDLEWSYMFGYGKDNKVQLNKSRVTQLIAPNGRGKSSIALILQELLCSKNVKGIKKGHIINRYASSKTYDGKLTFGVNEDNYLLTVSRTGDTSKVKLFQNGIDISEHKIPDTYKKLQSILGMDFEVLSQLTYQSSKNSLEFVSATDTNRKKFLINLFNLEQYLEYGEKIKKVLDELENQLLKEEGELNGITRFLTETEIKPKQTEQSLPEVDSHLEEEIIQLKLQIQEYENNCKVIDRNNLLIKERDCISIDYSLEPVDEENIRDIKRKIDTANQSITETTTILAGFEKQKKSLNLADSCYACGQHIDNSKSISLKAELDEKIVKANKVLEDIYFVLDGWTKNYKDRLAKSIAYTNNQRKIERFEQLSQLINNSISTIYPDISAIKNDFQVKSSQLHQQKEALEAIRAANERVRIFNTKVDALHEQKREFLIRQMLINDDILKTKARVDSLTILRKAFSTSGIVAFKLENLAKEFEELINGYLSELSDGQFYVVFKLEGEKLNINVISHEKESPIENVSEGELSRIQTSILLAIRKLLSKLGGSQINFLFLDEIMGVLDSAGKDKLIEILLGEDLNIFLVSHEYENPLLDKLYIEKENNISYIKESK